MNCIICGRESKRPVCEECTHKMMEEYPFLMRKSFIAPKNIFEIEEAIEKGIISDENLAALNDMAKRGLNGEDVDFEILAKAALLFHHRYVFYLENFEISPDYYLSLAELFVQRVEGDTGKFLRYKILKERGNLKGALKFIDSLAKKGKKEYLLEKAALLLEMGEKDAAQRLYMEILDDAYSWEHFADTLCALAEYESAAEAYMHVAELNPTDKVYYKLAQSLVKFGRYKDAIEYLEKAISINKYHLSSYILLHRIYKELDMPEDRKKIATRMKRVGFDTEFLEVQI